MDPSTAYSPHRLSLISRALAILTVGLAAGSVCAQQGPEDARESVWFPTDVRPQFDLQTPEEGWLQAGRDLYWTHTGGSSWVRIGPRLDPDARVLATAFSGDAHGWLVAGAPSGDGGADIVLFSTGDGGRQWQRRSLDLFAKGDLRREVVGAFLSFLDERTGWLVLGQRTSANFKVGTLFATTDGGASWEARTLPFAEAVHFISATRGWLAGGAARDSLYATTDGGYTWAKQALPAGPDRGRLLVGEPAFVGRRHGVVPLLSTTARAATFESYLTDDGGESWRRAGGRSVSPLISDATLVPFSLLPDGARVWMEPRAGWTAREFASGRRAEFRSTSPWLPGIQRLDMVDAETGWALYSDRPCDDPACRLQEAILTTTDAGQTWVALELPSIESLPAPEDALRGGSEGVMQVTGLTATFQGQGFDKCEIPSLAQLSAWATANPRGYHAVNLYIGGSARGCPNSALTASYVQQISSQGWKFIPTWVGPQASCSGFSSRMSSDPQTAYDQGVQEASAAIAAARTLGLTYSDSSGSVVYYDLEPFSASAPGCLAAAQSFVSGWSARLRQLNNLAGLYGSSCGSNIASFTSIPNVPDLAWLAAWYWPVFQGNYTSSATVWGTSCVGDSLWSNHQRIRQYAGRINDTWNGVTLVDIDADVIDGVVAVLGTGTSCSFTVAQGVSGSEATAIINAYNAAGGQATLGCPLGAVGTGFTSWNGTQAHYQNFTSGSIEYMLNGSYVGQAFAIVQPFYGKWAGLGLDSGNVMGYPIASQSAQTTSCIGTAYEFQRFEGGHLEYHMGGAHAGQVYEIHGLIRSKWDALGFAGCPLGLPTHDERDASASPQGSGGRVSDLEGGHIHYRWGDGAAYATWGALDSYYASGGGSASCLGFPNADQTTGGNGWPYATFEGGAIWTSNGSTYQKNCTAAGSNNSFTGAQSLAGLPVRATGSNVGATKEPGEPNHGGNVGGASVWWTWTAPFTAAVSISTDGSTFDTLLAVYTGSSVGGLTLVAQNDDNTARGSTQSRVQFTAQGGVVYRIAVDGYNFGSGASTGNVALRLYPAPTADLDADGRTDLLLWNASTWTLSTWTMDEAGARVSELALNPSGPPTGSWQAVGTNDFNGDQKTDLVYWDNSSGQVRFWLMNGVTRTGLADLGGAAPLSTSWRVVATGDFNRDGWPDLLWRDTATQKLVIWTMSGTNKIGAIVPTPDQAVDSNWAVVGALDYDGDGARDLLWYNATTGKIVFWFMNTSVQRITGQFASPANAGDNNWKVVAAGDYGIGTSGVPDSNDILWRNATSGRLVLWFMNTAGVRTYGGFTNPSSPADALGTTVVGPK